MRKLSVTIWHNVKETPSAGAVALTEDVFFFDILLIFSYIAKCTNES